MTIEEIKQRADKKMSADDYRSMSVSGIAQIRMDVKRLLKMLDDLRDQQEQSNEPRKIIFGRGEIAVDTVAENDNAPPREIMLRKLDSPILPIGTSTGGEGTSVDELNNIIVRMHFENPESVKVLIRAANIVLGTFGEQLNEPLTLDELRGMCGRPVWCSETKCWGIVVVEEGGRWDGTLFLLGYAGCQFLLDIESRGLTLYRRKPEQEAD